MHDAYPTVAADAVFFGPDSYRFATLLRRSIARANVAVDIGCGSGVGGLSLADRVERLILCDINARALSFARVNAALADVLHRVELVQSDVLASVRARPDLIVSNPPYLVDAAHRAYRDGGAGGFELTIRIAREALERLAPARRLVLYSGAPIEDDVDLLGSPCGRSCAATSPTPSSIPTSSARSWRARPTRRQEAAGHRAQARPRLSDRRGRLSLRAADRAHR